MTQLLLIYEEGKDAIDIAMIIFNEAQSRQVTATTEEIFSVLRLLIPRCLGFVLVFDGVDECLDQDQLFERLQDIEPISNSISIAIFSRPTIKIPTRMARNSLHIPLNGVQNLRDIRRYLRPKIRDMVKDNILRSTTVVEDVVIKISDRANGMFLWATLLVEYLSLPALSVRQRQEAIDNLIRLEGMDAIYTAILNSLTTRTCGQAKGNIIRLFQLVAWSYRPLLVGELECALAILPDRPLSHDDTIPNFAKSLGRISGALMEIVNDGSVRFVHLSVLEYVTSSKQHHSGSSAMTDTFCSSIGKDVSHLSCAGYCLSYLCYNVAAEPLGGSPQTTPDRKLQQRRYPFLEYAAEFWSHHALESLNAVDSDALHGETELIERTIQSAKTFLSNKHMVTTWIEASWMFQHPPQVRSGPNDEMLSAYFGRHHNRSLNGVETLEAFELLGRLARDLQELNSSWGDVLGKTPNEIWEPSISAFTKSPFWISTPGSKLTPLQRKDHKARGSICLKSQVSSDGLQIAVLRAIPNPR